MAYKQSSFHADDHEQNVSGLIQTSPRMLMLSWTGFAPVQLSMGNVWAEKQATHHRPASAGDARRAPWWVVLKATHWTPRETR